MSSGQQDSKQVSSGADKIGYGSDGIRSGTAAADQMSSTAKSHGGGVPKGSTVSDLQSAGSKSTRGGGGGQQ